MKGTHGRNKANCLTLLATGFERLFKFLYCSYYLNHNTIEKVRKISYNLWDFKVSAKLLAKFMVFFYIFA